MNTHRNVRHEVCRSDPCAADRPDAGFVGRREHHCGDRRGDVDLQNTLHGVSATSPVPWDAMGVWLLGGLLSLNGALCYAELATTYPRSGGDYHYLTEAFGRWMGFLFGWAQLAVILTGSIAAMAYAFADYGVRLVGRRAGRRRHTLWLAAGSIVVLSLLNLLGLWWANRCRICLSAVKISGTRGDLPGRRAVFVAWFPGSPGHVGRSRPGPGTGLCAVCLRRLE